MCVGFEQDWPIKDRQQDNVGDSKHQDAPEALNYSFLYDFYEVS